MGFSFNSVCSNTLPKGTYKAQVTDIHFKTSSTGAASNDMVVKYTILEGMYAKRNLSETISEKAFSFKLMPFLKAVGVDTAKEFGTAKELYEFGIKSAQGKTLNIVVDIRPYNGVNYNQVKDYIALPGSTTSLEEVSAEFGAMPELAPEKPTLTDLPTPKAEDISAPTLDLNNDDLPF